ncbi:endo-1,4-beta-xylanase [Fulvivirga ligni]|uniref:endo-1,4-beta-xylanase n=1 Tax=Fulvivirga ligni TaxID=2904246 RepID=UPI001F444184|nr:endo-1,4-beta-xylanase [Fulvivirga ligni]UII19579.1 endo-1,4-beta-xylanase [Fulvivirga ligni]
MKTYNQLYIKVLLPLFLITISFTNTRAQKFLGNIYQNSAPSNFTQFWNQVTPENSGKWGSAEPSRDNYNWGALDNAYNFANQNGLPFKGHTLVWGSQAPSWIGGLSQSDQRAEVEEWIRDYFQRYPGTDYIDVVNEPLHAPAGYRNALGGSGSTGWDWVITSFQLARQYAPSGCKLLLNEYGIISNPTEANNYMQIVNLLNARGLIDGIGIQCHSFNMDNVSTGTMNQVLGILDNAGLPIYVSELDMRGTDSQQLQRYQQKFPIFWENPNVAGVTLWGYIQGTMWESEAWLITQGGTQRPALQWLMNYVNDNTGGGGSETITVRARGTAGSEHINVRVNNTIVGSFTLGTSMQNYTATTNATGTVSVQFDNDGSGRDVQVDYIQVNGTTRQSEDQSSNTGVYQNSSCGGSYSEWLHCNGTITYSGGSSGTSISVRAVGTAGTEHINLLVNNQVVANWTLSTSLQTYTTSTTASGEIRVQFDNDGTGRDARIDYIQVNNSTLQAENQATNTGVWQNSSCGGSYSEWLHCNGYISFGSSNALAKKASENTSGLIGESELFPNPASNVLHVKVSGQQDLNSDLQIYDLNGAMIKQIILPSGAHEIDISHLQRGIYIVKLKSQDQVKSWRLLKQ